MKYTNENHELWIFQRLSRIEIGASAAVNTKHLPINELKHETISFIFSEDMIWTFFLVYIDINCNDTALYLLY